MLLIVNYKNHAHAFVFTLIKLAWESQLTDVAFKHYSSETKFLTATPPRALTLQTPNSHHISELFSSCYIFSKRSGLC